MSDVGDKVARSYCEADLLELAPGHDSLAELTLRDDAGVVMAFVKIDFYQASAIVDRLNTFRCDHVMRRGQQHRAGHA